MTTPAQDDQERGRQALDLLRAVRAAAETGIVPARGDMPSDPGGSLPREQALQELLRIVSAPHAQAGVELLCATGLAARLLPEVDALRLMPATGGRHKDVYRHTLLVLARTPPDPVLRLAALLHDIGKPATKTVEGGVVHFPGHAEVGAELARRRLRRLGAERELVESVSRLVALHLRANSYEDDWTDSAVRRLDRDAGDQLERLLALSRADVTSGRRDAVERALRRVDALEARIAAVRAADVRPESPLSGHDLMTLFGLPPGPWIGAVKSRLEAMVGEGALAADDQQAARAIAGAMVSEMPPTMFGHSKRRAPHDSATSATLARASDAETA
jgi:poly(A) polymerase